MKLSYGELRENRALVFQTQRKKMMKPGYDD